MLFGSSPLANADLTSHPSDQASYCCGPCKQDLAIITDVLRVRCPAIIKSNAKTKNPSHVFISYHKPVATITSSVSTLDPSLPFLVSSSIPSQIPPIHHCRRRSGNARFLSIVSTLAATAISQLDLFDASAAAAVTRSAQARLAEPDEPDAECEHQDDGDYIERILRSGGHSRRFPLISCSSSSGSCCCCCYYSCCYYCCCCCCCSCWGSASQIGFIFLACSRRQERDVEAPRLFSLGGSGDLYSHGHKSEQISVMFICPSRFLCVP